MAVIIWNLVDCNDLEEKIKEMEVSQKLVIAEDQIQRRKYLVVNQLSLISNQAHHQEYNIQITIVSIKIFLKPNNPHIKNYPHTINNLQILQQ